MGGEGGEEETACVFYAIIKSSTTSLLHLSSSSGFLFDSVSLSSEDQAGCRVGGHFPLILQPWAISSPFVWGRAELIEGSDPAPEVVCAEGGRSSRWVGSCADCPSPVFSYGDEEVLDISFLLHIQAPSFPSPTKNAGSLSSQR